MKKLYFFLSVVTLVVLLSSCLPGQNQSQSEPSSSPTSEATPAPVELSLRDKLLMSATLTVPESDLKITMTQTTTDFGDFDNKEDFGSFGTVTMGEQVEALGENGAITTLTFNYGGSGDLYYLAVFEPGKTSWQEIDMVSLGDRIEIGEITVNDGDITVSYKEHGPDQAMVDEPNVSVNKTFQYVDDKLTEVEE